MGEKLYIQMLGGCALRCGDKCVDDKAYRSRKLWLLLCYMITFRDRVISQEELIDLIYPDEKSANPAGALKTLIYRTRNMLNEVGYAGGHNMIVGTRGGYSWNEELDIELDTLRFETLCQQVEDGRRTAEERLQASREAVKLYIGDFLPKLSGEEWVVPYSIYFHSLYTKLVHTSVELLEEAGKWNDVVLLCQEAVNIDPYEEYFYYHMILGLVRTEQSQSALEQYRSMYNRFYTEIGVTPSSEMTALYKEIIRTTREVEADLTVIQSSMRGELEKPGAFLCELEVFKDIYNLMVRSAARTGQTTFLCLVTLTDQEGGMPPPKQLSSYMSRLADCIVGSLRRGDVVAQYSIAQYILLLSTTTVENCQKVADRILSRFRSKYPRCPLRVEASIQSTDGIM